MRVVIIYILFVLSFGTYAQSVSDVKIGFGLRTHFGGMQAFQDMLDHYNTHRPWLNNGFGTSSNMVGFQFGLEFSNEKFGLAMFQFMRINTRRVVRDETPSGEKFKRAVRMTMYGVEFVDIWWTPLHVKNMNIGFGIMPFGLAKMKSYTKFNDEKRERIYLSETEALKLLPSYYDLGHMYAQPHIDMTILNVAGEATLHVQLFKTWGPNQEYDVFYLNAKINPNSYQEFYKRSLLRMNNWGLKIIYNI